MKLNADLGEREPVTRTRELMGLIDLANIACGGHAGTRETMEQAVRLALEHRVAIGAHPGLAADFGRGAAEIDGSELEALVIRQVETLAEIAQGQGVTLHHIKLHGALYHAVERSEMLARSYLGVVLNRYGSLKIVAQAGGTLVARGREAGMEVWPEAFAERGYREDGSLVPRDQAGDLITDPREVAGRVRSLFRDGCVIADSGRAISLEAQTICVHSDTPNAVRIARAAREVLGPRA